MPNKKIQQLLDDPTGISFQKATKLRSLIKRPSDIDTVFNWIQQNTQTINHLFFYSWDLSTGDTDYYLHKIASVLPLLPNLRSLTLKYFHFFSNPNIQQNNRVNEFSNALLMCPSLGDLNLSQNGIDNNDLLHLLTSLPNLPVLISLDLGLNAIDDAVVPQLASWIKVSKLETLSLSSNYRLGYIGCLQILQSVNEASTLFDFGLASIPPRNFTPDEFQQYIAESKRYVEAKEQKIKLRLNPEQQYEVKSILAMYLDDLTDGVPNSLTIRALELALSTNEVTPNLLAKFIEINIWETIKQIRNILSHPYPQNRSTNYPYFQEPADHEMVVFKDEHGRPAFEKKGLLSLTAKDDEKSKITREGVCHFVKSQIQVEIDKLKLSAVRSIQLWYRALQTPNQQDEPSVTATHNM